MSYEYYRQTNPAASYAPMQGTLPYGYPTYTTATPAGTAGFGTYGAMSPGGMGSMMTPQLPSGITVPTGPMPGVFQPGVVSAVPTEESYIENILRMNLGKRATIYMTFENNAQWNAKVFKGTVEAAGRDHIIISDPQTGMRYLLLMVNLDYITFDEELTYTLPFGSAGTGAGAAGTTGTTGR